MNWKNILNSITRTVVFLPTFSISVHDKSANQLSFASQSIQSDIRPITYIPHNLTSSCKSGRSIGGGAPFLK